MADRHALASARLLVHHPLMGQRRSDAEAAVWRATDAERNERARLERLRRDGARSLSENLAAGVALARAARAFYGVALRQRGRRF